MSRLYSLGHSLLLATAVGCSSHRPASAPEVLEPTSAIATRLGVLSSAVSTARASLDSLILEIHGLSGNTSASALARSRRMRTDAASRDSTYRVKLADFLSTANAAAAGAAEPKVRFPVNAAPAPLLRGFVDGKYWMLQSPMIHEIGRNSPYVVIVPRGFVTDLTSIPQPLQVLGIQPNDSRYLNASIVHDYLYWRQDCTRAQSDNIMAIAMMEAGLSALERRLVYEAIRQFGQSAWDSNRRARQAGLILTPAPPLDQVPPSGTWAEYREWLRTVRAEQGVEYRVQQSVCAIADSVTIPR